MKTIKVTKEIKEEALKVHKKLFPYKYYQEKTGEEQKKLYVLTLISAIEKRKQNEKKQK